MLFNYGLHWQYAGYLKGFAISRSAKRVTKPPAIPRKPTKNRGTLLFDSESTG